MTHCTQFHHSQQDPLGARVAGASPRAAPFVVTPPQLASILGPAGGGAAAAAGAAVLLVGGGLEAFGALATLLDAGVGAGVAV